jgi:hypothetical protein
MAPYSSFSNGGLDMAPVLPHTAEFPRGASTWPPYSSFSNGGPEMAPVLPHAAEFACILLWLLLFARRFCVEFACAVT